MESLRRPSVDLDEVDRSHPLSFVWMLVRPTTLAVGWSADYMRRYIWPTAPLKQGRQAGRELEPLRLSAQHGVPPEGWVTLGPSPAKQDQPADTLASARSRLATTWPHLGVPRQDGLDPSPAIELRALSAWSALVDANLDAVDALNAAMLTLLRKVPMVVLPATFCFLLAALGAKSFVQRSLQPVLPVQLVLLLFAYAAWWATARSLRALVLVTDPRVRLLLAAAHALDCGRPARLVACTAGRSLHPPGECAEPDDLVTALADRQLDPLPIAPLLVAAGAPDDLAPEPRIALVELLYQRALELEHARLAASVSTWLARKDLVPIGTMLALGLLLVAMMTGAFRPTLAALHLH